MIKNWKRVVFFGAHSDDEMIAAGTLHRLSKSGCDVTVVAFSPAATIDDRGGTSKSAEILCDEFHRSMEIMGTKGRFCPLSIWNPSSRLAEHGQDIADYAFSFCESQKPDAAFILSPEDENPAHSEVGRQCERVMRGRVPHVVRCQFPWNYGIGRPNLFVSLSQEDVLTKGRVIDAYKSQHFRYGYSDMLLSCARADGLSVKTEWAEKFELIRSVV